MLCTRKWLLILWLLILPYAASATPAFVAHDPTFGVYGEPGSISGRTPPVPRQERSVDLWIKIGYSFYYTDVAVYFTTDGSEPGGAFGSGTGTTQVLRSTNGQIDFIRNEPHNPHNIDWWKTTLPANTRAYGTTVKYRIGAWHSGDGEEVFANTGTTYVYTVKIAWPGRGSPHDDHAAGYPPVHFWKEEGVVGNHYFNAMLDANGTFYDLYYPSVGAVYGVGTKNEGYANGLDTYPPGLPLTHRGQMNLNMALFGLRVDGKTYWQSNSAGGDYTGWSQSYIPDTNAMVTRSALTANDNHILVEQFDFSPLGVSYPTDLGGNPNRWLTIKRVLLTNQGATEKTIQFYFYSDFALNGGDNYDAAFTDAARGAMIAYDNMYRLADDTHEYNPTTFSAYEKNVSLYLAHAVKLCDSVGSAAGVPAAEFWNTTSSDVDKGWIGIQVVLTPGETREIDLALIGGFDTFANASGTYAYQMAPALDWFHATSMATAQSLTEDFWRDWLASGVTVSLPDARFNALFRRGLLATALHLDGKNGGVIAGMHNGAYPFVWPRDAVYAAVTLDRTGHSEQAGEVYRFLRDVAYRDSEPWGRSYWHQKYTTDGYKIWTNPQVDETAVIPWGALFHYNATGDLAFLNQSYSMIYEAGRASSEDSTLDNRIYYDDANRLMYSMGIWEDGFNEYLYSNAAVERGLRDAAAIALLTGHPGDIPLFTERADAIHQGILGRLQWDGENTDISHLGLVYPFALFSAADPAVTHLVDRMNGTATDRDGNNRPIVNNSGEWEGLINRYWGDTYWNGGPWFLSTAWYGLYYAERQDYTPGKSDIDILKTRLDLLLDRLGPRGLGAEQIAPFNSLLYAGQTDFALQAAWPNVWESMSTLTDAIMAFLDFTPDAPGNILRIAPKLPSAWMTMTYNNLKVGSHRLNVTVAESGSAAVHTFTNITGSPLDFETYLRLPADWQTYIVTKNDNPVANYAFDAAAKRIRVTEAMTTGANVTTTVTVTRTNAISGTVLFEDIDPNAAPQEVTFEFRPVGGGPASVRVRTLPAIGTFSFSDILPGEYALAVKGPRNLRKVVPVNSLSAPVTGVSPLLLAGDANDDNAVDVLDLDLLIQAFDSLPDSPNWNSGADFNGDESVDVLDLDLLIRNFDQPGDE